MEEYLTTTTLGDLMRSSKEAAAATSSAEATASTFGSNNTASSIRPAIGEINQ
jgi:hypothetical protein